MDPRTEKLVQQYTTERVTLEDLGVQEGVTRERIRQILKKAGVTAANSHRRLSRSAREAAQQRELWDRHCLHYYGCDFATVKKITGRDRYSGLRSHKLIRLWWHHKQYAQRNFLEWKFTLPEYAELILPNILQVKLRRDGLVLSRKDKAGPFSKDNCRLIPLRELAKETDGFSAARKLRSQRTLEARIERVKSVLDMRRQGMTYEEIAKRIKRSAATVSVLMQKAKGLNLE